MRFFGIKLKNSKTTWTTVGDPSIGDQVDVLDADVDLFPYDF